MSDDVLERYTVWVDGEPNLCFEGTCIADVEDRWRNGQEQTRWSIFRLYRLANNTFVCERVRRSMWMGEGDRHEAAHVNSVKDVMKFFEYSDLAKRLYDKAKFDATARVP
ncbi:MAG: hypothetical protein R3322_00430 [Kiloniellales bacterium]|nr:hypothetical protein [Kiloniellales bacterium]